MLSGLNIKRKNGSLTSGASILARAMASKNGQRHPSISNLIRGVEIAESLRPGYPVEVYLEGGEYLGKWPSSYLRRVAQYSEYADKRKGRIAALSYHYSAQEFLELVDEGWTEEALRKTESRTIGARLCSKFACETCRRPCFSGECAGCSGKERSKRLALINGRMREIREVFALSEHSREEWLAVLDEYGGKCLRCGTTDNVTKDHIQPISRGGSNDINNLQPLCGPCNSWKHTKTIDFRSILSEATVAC